MKRQFNNLPMKTLEEQYIDITKIYKRLSFAIERYKNALPDKNVNLVIQEIMRDSLIKRFDLTYELLVRYLHEYMIATHGIIIDSPRKPFQQC